MLFRPTKETICWELKFDLSSSSNQRRALKVPDLLHIRVHARYPYAHVLVSLYDKLTA